VLLDISLPVAGDFGTALLLGALLGIEREKRNEREGFGIAGLRSFVLLALIGAVAGHLAKTLSMGWILAVALLVVALVVIAGYFAAARKKPEQLGLTTELAAIATCLLGALATTGNRELAVGLGVLTAALLAYKQPLHALVGKLGVEDVFAGMRFLLATFIVLPLMPDKAIDPWGAINPYRLWLLVLLISGLSLLGYVASRWLGPGRGTAVTAATGGLVSSTAVTLTFVKQSHEPHANGASLAGGILLAWAVMFARVVVAATLVHPPLCASLSVPFGAMLVACSVAAVLCFARSRRGGGPATAAGDVLLKNPFSLVAAGKFALLFGAVQLLLKLAQTYLPQSGTYVVAAVAGLTDVDAITLSMAQQAKAQADAMATAVLAILLAAASNTIVKAAMAAGMGHRRLRLPVLVSTAAVLVAGAAALLLT
jgi:uncharacterized membrane protein (DUF4010 family)